MYVAIDTLWVLIGTALVFFMQAGFAMVETGFTRAKNAGNIIMKNIMDFAMGTVVFWAIGFGLMFASNNSFIGGLDFFVQGNYGGNIPTSAFIIFQTVFCGTAATIISGAMAERTKFSSYLIYSLILSAFIYPISGHWIWGGGWLSELGFKDFAGSTAVHLVGGVAALVGAKILGPRIGKFSKEGKPHAIPGHSLTLGALGVFILWFCWFGFNGASTLSMSGDSIKTVSDIFVTTNLSAAVSTITVMIITWIKYKKPDVSMTLNGALIGLVAITAGCNVVSPTGAFFIGLIAAFFVVFGVEFIEKVLKIDDPVGAAAVHGLGGAVGTILVGVFAVEGGLLYGGGFELLKVQAIGVLAVATWTIVAMGIVFLIVKNTLGLRVTPSEEINGLDIEEHGLQSSYADFIHVNENNLKVKEENLKKCIEVINNSKSNEEIKKIIILTNKSKLEILRVALDAVGIKGMTVTEVLGYGLQKGALEYYRGVEVESKLLPKIKVEIVVCKISIEELIKAIKLVLYTGNIGDGKIFIQDVENVIKVRTGEEGYEALIED